MYMPALVVPTVALVGMLVFTLVRVTMVAQLTSTLVMLIRLVVTADNFHFTLVKAQQQTHLVVLFQFTLVMDKELVKLVA